MTTVTDLELAQIDLFDPALRGERFHRTMRELAEQSWIVQTPLGFIVLDREAGSFFLRTKQASFPGLKIAELFGIEDGPLHEEIVRNILHVPPDKHRRLRNLVNPFFTPRAADRWRPAMRGFVEQLHAAVEAERRCEFVEAFAKPYPSLTIATVMGAALSDAPRLHEWSNWIQRQFDGPSLMTERERIEQAVAEFYDWAGELLARRRQDPSDDLISSLIAARFEGDKLDDAELVNLVLNVLVGGVDTTQSQLAQAVRLFAEHPDQWELVRSDPDMMAPRAVEEVLRYEPITPFTARIVEEEITCRDIVFPVDTVVMVCAFTGNREPGEPDVFDVAAERDAKPLTFGAGIHYCLGANLARAELQEALGFLARRWERIELDGEPVMGSINGIYGIDELPIRWTAV
ncbi:MAG: cytochrome P450 [Solirubrobacteraceae bacterium]|jgi:cytochrome P450